LDPGLLADPAERSAHISVEERRADGGGKDEVVLLPLPVDYILLSPFRAAPSASPGKLEETTLEVGRS
jgi:hypothetical protein